jgi:nicotinamide riboside kinase
MMLNYTKVNALEKIAFIGTHSVGKTTFIKKLVEKNPSSIVINELFRSTTSNIFNLHGLTKANYFEPVYHNFSHQVMIEMEATTSNAKYLYTDRSAFDCFVYFDVISNKQSTSNILYMRFKATAKEYLQTYDKIYLIIPEDRTLQNDGFRDTNKVFRQQIHEHFIEELYYMKNVEMITLDDLYTKFNITY